MPEPQTSAASAIKVWDWPVRLSHWSFAVLVPAMWYTADNSLWWWHTRLGMVLLAVLIFRVLWGFAGSETARFSQFVRGPKAVLAYLRGAGEGYFGHNPLGALSVIALLAAMFAQVGMGLFGGDPFDGATGPLNGFVGVMTADTLTDWHETFVWVIAGLVVLHLSAIAFYAAAKRTNLVGPMVTGKKQAEPEESGLGTTATARAVTLLILSIAISVWIWFGAPPFG